MILWSGFASPIQAPPGEYTVTMTAGSYKKSAKFKWLKDPRWSATDKDLVDKFQLQQKIASRTTEANDAVVQVRFIRTGLDKALEEAAKKGELSNLTAMSDKLRAGLTKVEEAIYQTKNRSGQDPLNYPIRLNDKLAGVFSNVSNSNFRPTDQAYEVFDLLSKALGVELADLKKLIEVDLATINAELKRRGVVEVASTPPPRGDSGGFDNEPTRDGDRDGR